MMEEKATLDVMECQEERALVDQKGLQVGV